mgnify:CR=1 FL=1
MLSVVESAEILQVTPTRVRALIAQGALPAQKVGRTWTLREEDVMQRAATRPSAGRPRKADVPSPADDSKPHAAASELYRACKDHLAACPSAAEIAAIDDPEQAAFRIAVATSSSNANSRSSFAKGSSDERATVLRGVRRRERSRQIHPVPQRFLAHGGMPATMARVNPDEILREQGGDWSNGQDQVAAGRIALRSVDEHLAARRSFNQETTLAGHRACAPWPKHARRDTACSCSTSALQTRA